MFLLAMPALPQVILVLFLAVAVMAWWLSGVLRRRLPPADR